MSIKSLGFWIDVVLILAGLSVLLPVFFVWGWSSSIDWITDGESNSGTIRNVGLVVAAVIAMRLAMWRSRVAERQAGTAQSGLLNERYQKGAEMLGSEILSVRLGGIYALQRLAEDHPEEYHVQIMRLFCAFTRHPTQDNSVVLSPAYFEATRIHEDWQFNLRLDVQAIMEAIAKRRASTIAHEKTDRFITDFRSADLRQLLLEDMHLSDLYIIDADLSGASFSLCEIYDVEFSGANLSPARFAGAHIENVNWEGCSMIGVSFNDASCGPSVGLIYNDLTSASFVNANLTGVRFCESDLSEAKFFGANLSNTRFSRNGMLVARNLTQAQLDQAVADPDNPPILDGVADAETGEQLVWRGSAPST